MTAEVLVMHNSRLTGIIVSVLAVGLLAACEDDKGSAAPAVETDSAVEAAPAVETGSEEVTGPAETGEKRYYTPPEYAENVYFGDAHIHTEVSLDASLWGNRLSPADA
jgi:hypothetical protein